MWTILQKLCIADPFTAKNQQMDLKPKKLYSTGYNLLFDIITIPSEAFFIWINEFADACGIPHPVLVFNSLPLRGLSLVLICPTLIFCTHWFSLFCDSILHTMHWVHSHMNFNTQNIFLCLKPNNPLLPALGHNCLGVAAIVMFLISYLEK